jgi:two-component system, cell cycle sensor histidine kinase and response regulator CckA
MAKNNLVIVAIDDMPDNLITLRAVLADVFPDAEVKTATNGRQGIELARTLDPDVILLDVLMPGMDGFEVCRTLKDDERLRQIPVVFLTALRSDRAARLRAIEAGAEGFLIKPIEEAELIAQIRAMAKIKAANTSQRREQERLAALVAERTRELEQELVVRRNTEAALRESEKTALALLNATPDAAFMIDIAGTTLALNDEVARWLGQPKKGSVGKCLYDFLSPEVAKRRKATVAAVVRSGQPIRFEDERNGRVIDSTFYPLFDAHGSVTRIAAFGRDITERLQAEEALADERRLLRTVIDNLPDAIYAKDMNARKTLANRAELELIGAASELDVLGRTDLESFPPETAERSMADDWRVLQTGQPMLDYEELFVDAQGKSRWLLSSKYPLRDDAGRTNGLVGIGRDITERKRAEEALADERRLLRTVIDNLPDAIYAKDAHARKTLANRADLEFTGSESESDVLGTRDQELFRPEVAERLIADDLRVVQTGQPLLDYEELLVDNQGKSRWLLTSKYPLKDDAGRTVGLVGIGRDITERKQAEAERTQLLAQIEAQARQVRQILETVPQGMVLLDADGRVLLTNPVAERDMALLAHGSGDRLLGLGEYSLSELLTSLPGEQWHEVRAGGRIFEVIARPIPGDGDSERWVLVIDDATLKRQARDERQRQEQLAAIGQLAAGIAHDFNNIMAVIVLYAQMVSGQEGLPPSAREKVDVIHGQAHRATELIQQILDFSRRAPMERQPMQLLPLLKEVMRLWERTLPESIRIELVRDASACRISADPTRIQQVLMNLATNARDAMPEGGSLLIELCQVTCDADAAAPSPTMAAGEWVRLDFTDTGTGMPAEVLSHIFEPFFTTKAPGEGTGLGLAQAHGIIKQHDGEILVESALGQGTTFSIYLPALPVNESTEIPPLEAGSLPQGAGQLILVVEDNAATREALIGALELLGYRILPAVDGREALAIYTTHLGDGVDPVNLIISDLTMPDMGGKALASALRELGSTVPMVILSGHIRDDDFRVLADLGVVQCLRKPLDLPELAKVVAEVLGAPSSETLDRD